MKKDTPKTDRKYNVGQEWKGVPSPQESLAFAKELERKINALEDELEIANYSADAQMRRRIAKSNGQSCAEFVRSEMLRTKYTLEHMKQSGRKDCAIEIEGYRNAMRKIHDIADRESVALYSAKYVLEDCPPEKLAEISSLPVGVIVDAMKNIFGSEGNQGVEPGKRVRSIPNEDQPKTNQ
jgi:hypothetical protein